MSKRLACTIRFGIIFFIWARMMQEPLMHHCRHSWLAQACALHVVWAYARDYFLSRGCAHAPTLSPCCAQACVLHAACKTHCMRRFASVFSSSELCSGTVCTSCLISFCFYASFVFVAVAVFVSVALRTEEFLFACRFARIFFHAYGKL